MGCVYSSRGSGDRLGLQTWAQADAEKRSGFQV
jgi:hypothetical protein